MARLCLICTCMVSSLAGLGSLSAYEPIRNQPNPYQDAQVGYCPCGCGCRAPCNCGCASGRPCTCQPRR